MAMNSRKNDAIDTEAPSIDALLLLSFGGPDGPQDVMPYLDRVLDGRRVPAARKREVAEHYARFGGRSPINAQNRQLLARLQQELESHHVPLRLYWGNRFWHPLIPDTIARMAADRTRHALVLITSPFSSYSSCRQYLEEAARACEQVGPTAPRLSKLRAYYNHPQFVAAWRERVREATADWPAARRQRAAVLFTAHSIPVAMPGCDRYVAQLHDLAAVLAEELKLADAQWQIVYQSRSGRPGQAWLEPDVRDVIRLRGQQRFRHDVLMVPIGFVSDHVEVLYDLDVEASEVAENAGVRLSRVCTVGTHPRMITMIRALIEERLSGSRRRPTVGRLGPAPDQCPADCCRPPTQ